MTREDRFWAKVNRDGPLPAHRPDLGPCWLWVASTMPNGYGRCSAGLAHRFAYETSVGPIPDGLTIDHLCRNHACVNPAHLEPVTRKENVLRGEGPTAENARKTHCKRGHAFTPENTLIHGDGWRRCRACHVAGYTRRHALARAERVAA